MKNIIYTLLFVILITSCQEKSTEGFSNQNNWKKRAADSSIMKELKRFHTYLPVYSHIYDRYEHKTFDLTITISIKNISVTDTLYLFKADYFNTYGDKIREYLNYPVYIKPLETVEIIIAEKDTEGGSGANFIFEWGKKHNKNKPLFEAVMISTYGQQGLSFTTRGVDLVVEE